MMRDPKTEPIPAPDPATPTVAAPAPMNLAAESMSFLTVVVVKARLACNRGLDENQNGDLTKGRILVTCCDQTEATTGLCQPDKTLLLQLEMAIRAI